MLLACAVSRLLHSIILSNYLALMVKCWLPLVASTPVAVFFLKRILLTCVRSAIVRVGGVVLQAEPTFSVAEICKFGTIKRTNFYEI